MTISNTLFSASTTFLETLNFVYTITAVGTLLDYIGIEHSECLPYNQISVN